MSKEDDIKFLKIQTCVLKVNIHCEGCKQKVKKLLQKVDGVFQTNIDAEQGRVTVSGNADPATLIKKLNKAGKHAELLLPKGVNITQLQKSQLQNPKAQQNRDNGKPSKGSGGGGGGAGGAGGGKDKKAQPMSEPQLQQTKGFKDLKLPHFRDLKLPFQKDPKSVKFALPPQVGEDGSDYSDVDDDDDDDDDDLDEFDSFDADIDDDFRNLKLKPGVTPPNAMNGVPIIPQKKAEVVGVDAGGRNGKKGSGGGGAIDIPMQIKGINANNDGKYAKKGGAVGVGKGDGGNGGKNAGKGGVGGAQDAKNGGNNGKTNPNAHGGKVGGKNEGGGFGGVGNVAGPLGGAGYPAGINAGQMGSMPHMGNMPVAVQGLPAGMAPAGYFPGGGMPTLSPEMMAASAGGSGNPYQQQYMAALMLQQQQHQRMMMMNGQDRGAYPPMMSCTRPMVPPPAAAMYMPPQHGEPYTNYFSDENANNCSIM